MSQNDYSAINGMVSSIDDTSLVVAGISGKTKVQLGELTRYFIASRVSASDLAIGAFVEIRPVNASALTITADTVKILSSMNDHAGPAESFGGPSGPGGPGGPGGPSGSGGPGGPGGRDTKVAQSLYVGKIATIKGDKIHLTLQLMGGMSKEITILIDKKTDVIKLSEAEKSSLKEKATVFVEARMGEGKVLEAETVEIWT
jgi:hypothetical protein